MVAKQDLVLDTKIDINNKILINDQFVGELKGLKFIIALTSKTLDTDIKSIKKAVFSNASKPSEVISLNLTKVPSDKF